MSDTVGFLSAAGEHSGRTSKQTTKRYHSIKDEFITRRPNSFKSVMNGIKAALEQDFSLPVKLNCVVMRGFNDVSTLVASQKN